MAGCWQAWRSRAATVTSAAVWHCSSVFSTLGFKIKLHLVLTMAVTCFVTLRLFLSERHSIGLGGGLHFLASC